jgi:hypothetical protein
VLYGNNTSTLLREVHGYQPGWGSVSDEQRAAINAIMAGASEGGSALPSVNAQG